MPAKFRSRVTGLLTCVAAVVAAVSLRFARSAFVGIVDRGFGADAVLSRLTTFALGVTRPAILLPLLLLCVAIVVAAEVTAKSEAVRLLVQVLVLLILVSLLAIVLAGFLITFHIPEVTIS
jgi:hypothetical protein